MQIQTFKKKNNAESRRGTSFVKNVSLRPPIFHLWGTPLRSFPKGDERKYTKCVSVATFIVKLTEASRSERSMLQKCVTVAFFIVKLTEASRSERSMLQKCVTVSFFNVKLTKASQKEQKFRVLAVKQKGGAREPRLWV